MNYPRGPHQTYTPGPWVHKATAGEHDFAVYSESDGRDVALVRDFHAANANLIAAAPEMYEALVELGELVDGESRPNLAMRVQMIVDAALASATPTDQEGEGKQ